MEALQIISEYQMENAGLSSYIDNQLIQIQQSLQDAIKRREEGNEIYYQVNIAIAVRLAARLLEMTPTETPRQTTERLYKAILEL